MQAPPRAMCSKSCLDNLSYQFLIYKSIQLREINLYYYYNIPPFGATVKCKFGALDLVLEPDLNNPIEGAIQDQVFIYLFIYWARIKMNIYDRWFAKKCEINTMLKSIRFT